MTMLSRIRDFIGIAPGANDAEFNPHDPDRGGTRLPQTFLALAASNAAPNAVLQDAFWLLNRPPWITEKIVIDRKWCDKIRRFEGLHRELRSLPDKLGRDELADEHRAELIEMLKRATKVLEALPALTPR